eukprot:tig00021682_g23097.t1
MSEIEGGNILHANHPFIQTAKASTSCGVCQDWIQVRATKKVDPATICRSGKGCTRAYHLSCILGRMGRPACEAAMEQKRWECPKCLGKRERGSKVNLAHLPYEDAEWLHAKLSKLVKVKFENLERVLAQAPARKSLAAKRRRPDEPASDGDDGTPHAKVAKRPLKGSAASSSASGSGAGTPATAGEVKEEPATDGEGAAASSAGLAPLEVPAAPDEAPASAPASAAASAPDSQGSSARGGSPSPRHRPPSAEAGREPSPPPRAEESPPEEPPSPEEAGRPPRRRRPRRSCPAPVAASTLPGPSPCPGVPAGAGAGAGPRRGRRRCGRGGPGLPRPRRRRLALRLPPLAPARSGSRKRGPPPRPGSSNSLRPPAGHRSASPSALLAPPPGPDGDYSDEGEYEDARALGVESVSGQFVTYREYFYYKYTYVQGDFVRICYEDPRTGAPTLSVVLLARIFTDGSSSPDSSALQVYIDVVWLREPKSVALAPTRMPATRRRELFMTEEVLAGALAEAVRGPPLSVRIGPPDAPPPPPNAYLVRYLYDPASSSVAPVPANLHRYSVEVPRERLAPSSRPASPPSVPPVSWHAKKAREASPPAPGALDVLFRAVEARLAREPRPAAAPPAAPPSPPEPAVPPELRSELAALWPQLKDFGAAVACLAPGRVADRATALADVRRLAQGEVFPQLAALQAAVRAAGLQLSGPLLEAFTLLESALRSAAAAAGKGDWATALREGAIVAVLAGAPPPTGPGPAPSPAPAPGPSPTPAPAPSRPAAPVFAHAPAAPPARPGPFLPGAGAGAGAAPAPRPRPRRPSAPEGRDDRAVPRRGGRPRLAPAPAAAPHARPAPTSAPPSSASFPPRAPGSRHENAPPLAPKPAPASSSAGTHPVPRTPTPRDPTPSRPPRPAPAPPSLQAAHSAAWAAAPQPGRPQRLPAGPAPAAAAAAVRAAPAPGAPAAPPAVPECTVMLPPSGAAVVDEARARLSEFVERSLRQCGLQAARRERAPAQLRAALEAEHVPLHDQAVIPLLLRLSACAALGLPALLAAVTRAGHALRACMQAARDGDANRAAEAGLQMARAAGELAAFRFALVDARAFRDYWEAFPRLRPPRAPPQAHLRPAPPAPGEPAGVAVALAQAHTEGVWEQATVDEILLRAASAGLATVGALAAALEGPSPPLALASLHPTILSALRAAIAGHRPHLS